MTRLVVLAVAALLLAPAASASEQDPTLNELENEVKIAAGRTKSQIKDFIVQQYGESILAAPPKRGFNLLAWVLPLAGIGVAALSLGVAAWGWTRGRGDPEPLAVQSSNGQGPIDPELDRRVDEELSRFE